MEWCILSFIIGAILSLFLPVVPEFSLLILISLLCIATLFFKVDKKLPLFLLGASWLLIAGHQYLTLAKNNLPGIFQHKSAVLLVRGEVSNIADEKQGTTRFIFNISHANQRLLPQPITLKLSWNKAPQKIRQGQVWRLAVKLKPAHGLANLGAFNYQQWLIHHEISATGYVKKNKINHLIGNTISWRDRLFHQYQTLLSDHDLSPILMALGFGERSELKKEHWRVLSSTSTQHLIAISGLHIGLVAYTSFWVARLLIQYLPFIQLRSTSQRALMQHSTVYCSAMFSCLMASYYSYLAGFSIPTLRAITMLLVYWCFRYFEIGSSHWRTLLLTVLFIIFIWPLSLLSVSFWLSVSALVIIFTVLWRQQTFQEKTYSSDNENDKKKKKLLYALMFFRHKNHAYKKLLSVILLQSTLIIFMLPIASTLHYQVPLLAILANLIVVPLMSISTIPLTLMSVLALPISESLAKALMYLSLESLEISWAWLTYLADIDGAVLPISQHQLSIFSCAIVLVLCRVVFYVPKNWLVMPVYLLLFYVGQEKFAVKNYIWQLTVLDVGHGLAIAIERNGHVLLYDTGVSYPSGFNMGDAAVIPYLRYQGYSKIDKIILSHSDNDHTGGLASIERYFPIANIMVNDLSLPASELCLAGNSFDWQTLQFKVLSPESPVGDKNDHSCVLSVSDGFNRVLLTGDISKKIERRLLRKDKLKNDLVSDLLIAPHHGSKSSSSVAFLAKVSPQYAVFSSGYLNRWQMPSPPILDRYNRLSIETLTTADVGMIRFHFNEKGIEVATYRENFRPYWHTK